MMTISVSEKPTFRFSLIMLYVTKMSKCLYLEGDLLLDFSLHCDPNSCMDKGGKERYSFESKESRKETYQCGDDGENSPARKPSSAFSRQKAFKNLKSADKVSLLREKMEASDGSCALLKSRRHTARVVVMGDDRVLGRLARAYHAIRWESFTKTKSPFLEKFSQFSHAEAHAQINVQ